MTLLNKGDLYRVVIEGTWNGCPDENADIVAMIREGYFDPEDDKIAVEVIPRPFAPGDRLTTDAGDLVTLASRGYLQHFSDGSVEFYRYPPEGISSFSPDHFKRVDA